MITLDSLWRLIDTAEDASADERKMLHDTAIRFLGENWSVTDVYNYLHCTCYISPNMNEDLACERMAEIRRKYAH